MKISKKRKRIRFVSKEIRGFAPQGVNRRAVRKCLAVQLFFCGKIALSARYALFPQICMFYAALFSWNIEYCNCCAVAGITGW